MMLTPFFVFNPILTGVGADSVFPCQIFLNDFLQQLFMNVILFDF